jgi:hypothetical protein
MACLNHSKMHRLGHLSSHDLSRHIRLSPRRAWIGNIPLCPNSLSFSRPAAAFSQECCEYADYQSEHRRD